MPWHAYIDDSGTREYADDQDYESSGKSRYFVYAAVLGEERPLSLLASRWRDLKALRIGNPDVEIKSNWLRIEKERRPRYLEPYGLSPDDLRAFVDDCYKLIALWPVALVATIVDKLHMQETYASPWYAPTVAYEVLLQRIVQAVPKVEPVAVTIDDIGGRTPKRNEYRRLLDAHHRRLKKDGSSLLKGVPARSLSFAQLSDQPRFVNSAHSELIQVADLVSYNVHRQFRDHGDAWERKPATPADTLPMYPYFERIAGRFLKDGSGRVQGFGIVKFPLKNRVRWTVAAKEGKGDAAP